MNTATQAVHLKIDDLSATPFPNAAEDGVAVLDPSRPSIIQAIRFAISTSIGSLTENLT